MLLVVGGGVEESLARVGTVSVFPDIVKEYLAVIEDF